MKLKRSPWRYCLLLAALMLAAFPAMADFEAAMGHFKAGRFLEAASEFQALVDQSPEWAPGYHMLGICFMKTAKQADAEKNFLKAIELQGDVFSYHYNLANAYQERQQWGKVVSTLNAAEKLAAAQEMPLLYKLRGFALAAQKKWGDSIGDLEKSKKDAPTLTQLGKAYFTLGESEKAISNLRAALKLSPGDAESHQLMAESLLNMGARATSESTKTEHYSEALTEARAFAKAKPNVSAARNLVARAALGAGDYQLAVAEFTKVLELKPGNCTAMANQGKAFMALQDWNNALAALDNATRCQPSLTLAWENKGFALQKQKKYDDAVIAYKKALQLQPSSMVAQNGVETCNQNKDVIAHNVDVAEQEAAQEARIQAEQDRVAAEQAKVEEWKARQDDD